MPLLAMSPCNCPSQSCHYELSGRTIRQNQKFQPVVIAMTANAMQSDKAECIKAGMDDYLSKPVILEDLVNMLEKWAVRIKNDTAYLTILV